MRNLISTLFFVLLILSAAQAQQNSFLTQKSKILDNQIDNLTEFQKIANKIDSDSESYWAYGQAKELLKSVDRSGKNFHRDLSRIYAAYTHIFYGMSYSRSIMAISRDEDYSLGELTNTLIKNPDLKKTDYYNLSKQELSSIYGMINFYKVSRMPKYPDMFERFQRDSLKNEQLFREYPAISAFRIRTLNNKKLYYITFVNLIIDIYAVNNPNVTDSDYKEFTQKIVELGQKMDRVPSNYETIIALSDHEYYHWITVGSSVQNALLGLLVNELESLGN